MSQVAYTLFDTKLGRCGIAWKVFGHSDGSPQVVCFQLPEAAAQITEARIAGRWAAHKTTIVPPQIGEVIKRVKLHFMGQTQDFRDVDINLDGTSQFAKRVYNAAREIPSGSTATYGQLAEDSGSPGAARAVGQLMGKNPIPLIIPCHRVLGAGNKPGGFSAHGGLATKAKMLDIEGVTFGPRSRSGR
jgi:O-6-methylguanine DNA methyltransferase